MTWIGYPLRAALLAVVWLVGGCASMPKKPAADHVIEARDHTRRGIDAQARNDWEQAEQQFSEAVSTCPIDKDAHRCYAEALWHNGQSAQAIRHMEEAVRLSGGEPGMLVLLGEMEFLHGASHRALARSEQAIARDRNSASAWALRADALRRLERNQEALASYHRALSCQPQFPRVQLALAELYGQLGRPRRSLATLNALAEGYLPDAPPAQVRYLQGLAMKDLGRHFDAVERLVSVAKDKPSDPNVMFHLAEAKWMTGDVAGAQLAVRNGLQLAPEHDLGLRLASQIDGGRRVASAPRQ